MCRCVGSNCEESQQFQSADGQTSLNLPTLTECDLLPGNRNEIPTPNAAQHHSHLQDITTEIPELDPHAEIQFLLGRDIIQAHKVLEQRNGTPNAPLAQRLALGWVIVGNVRLGGAHKPGNLNVPKNQHSVLATSFHVTAVFR